MANKKLTDVNKNYIPIALFDTNQELQLLYKTALQHDAQAIFKSWLDQLCPIISVVEINDFQQALYFLYHYRGSEDTFNAYRKELERFLQWSWFIRKQSILNTTA